jgi:hypothetical protein
METREKLFRENYLFSREDIIKSFEMFLEHVKLNEYPKYSSVVLRNRITLCEKFLATIKKCKLPVLTDLWNFYEYRFLIDSIELDLCDASDIEMENNELGTVSVTVEHTLINIECEYLTINQFAAMHQVDEKTVGQWICNGRLRHAKKVGQNWLIPNTQDKPKRGFDTVQYVVKADEKISNYEFPTLALIESVFISQDSSDKKIYHAHFRNFTSGYNCEMDLSRDEVERLEYIIIESGKATIEATIQFNPYIRDPDDSE